MPSGTRRIYELAATTTEDIALGAHVIRVGRDLTAFCNTYEVDGRVSWHPPEVRGHATVNCYLLKQDGNALLIDTGVGAHRTDVTGQLADELPASTRLEILLLRQGEFDSIGNLLPLARSFSVKTIYGQFSEAPRWGDIHPDLDATDGWNVDGEAVATVVLSRQETIELGEGGVRQLSVFRPLLRLLSTHWVYDPLTRSLFTSDSFAYVVRPSDAGPWMLTSANDDMTGDQVREHLMGTRYWWLARSTVDELRRSLAAVFEAYEVEQIAPAFGAIITGSDAVARHVALVDEALVELGQSSAAIVRT